MDFMKIAIEEAKKGLKKKEGGPFGAVIVRKGKVIAKAHNRVLKSKDPTEHAEIKAIRIASKKLKKFDLSDCKLYTTCEPCPMCYSAIFWARIKKVYYGASSKDAEKIGFKDKELYEILNGKRKPDIKKIKIDSAQAVKLMKVFADSVTKRY